MNHSGVIEKWRSIPGFEKFYKVSDLGRVRSLSRIRTSGLPLPGKILKQGSVAHDYKSVVLCVNNKTHTKLVHRLVLEAFVGPCPEGMQTRHYKDRDVTNNRLTNLQWGSAKENAADRAKHGVWKAASGEKCGRAKRTEKDIEEMFRMRHQGTTLAIIARHFSASPSCVSRALRGLEWAHVYKRVMQGERS